MNNEMIVEILNADPDTKSGTFENYSGQTIDYEVKSQEAKLETGGFAYPYKVRLEKSQKPYAVGKYRLAIERMVEVSNGALRLGKYPKLIPLAASPAK